MLSTSTVHAEKQLPHFKEREQIKEAEGDDDRTLGNEVYRMPHPIW